MCSGVKSATSFPGSLSYPSLSLSLLRDRGRREPWERGCEEWTLTFSTKINHEGLQRTANEYAEERRIYKDLISKNNNVDILNSASRILQCWSYYVKINSARHQHDTERTQNRAGFSLQASSLIWVSEVSLAKTRERGSSRVLARLASRPNRRACSQAKRDCSHRQLFRPFWGSSVWRNNQRKLWWKISASAPSPLGQLFRSLFNRWVWTPCSISVPLYYRKIPKWVPGLIFFKGPFWGAYFCRGLSTEGNLRFKIDWASLVFLWRYSRHYHT